MKIGARQPTPPVLRVVCTRHAKGLRSRCHALAKFFWKTGEGMIVQPKRPHAIPAESHRDPLVSNWPDRTAAAVVTFSVMALSQARPAAGSRNVKNSYRAASAGERWIRKCWIF